MKIKIVMLDMPCGTQVVEEWGPYEVKNKRDMHRILQKLGYWDFADSLEEKSDDEREKGWYLNGYCPGNWTNCRTEFEVWRVE